MERDGGPTTDADPRLTIPGAIAEHAAARPDAPALLSDRRSLTWRDLHLAVSGIASALRARGVSPADRVAFHSAAPVPFGDLVTIYGLMSACAVVMIDSRLPLAARVRLLERTTPLALVTPPHRDPAGLPIDPWIVESATRLSGPERIAGRCRFTGPGPSPSDVAVVLGSSGTTAEQKLIPVRHETLMSCGKIDSEAYGLGPADRLLLNLSPQFGVFGTAPTPLWEGGSTLVAEEGEAISASRLANLRQPTWVYGTPASLATIADQLVHLAPGPATSFRFVVSTGAPASSTIEDRIARGFRAPRIDGYGSTEAFSIASAGRITGTVRVAGPDGRLVPDGEPGEIQATGPLVFSGYIDDPDLTAAAFTSDGWFRTGDAGRIEPDGGLKLLGRLAEQINRGGLKISPQEIETAMRAHPEIAEAAAFAIPHPAHGQIPGLAVVLLPGSTLTPRKVRRWLLGRLPGDKVPSQVLILDDLPATATGKVSRRALAALITPRDAGS